MFYHIQYYFYERSEVIGGFILVSLILSAAWLRQTSRNSLTKWRHWIIYCFTVFATAPIRLAHFISADREEVLRIDCQSDASAAGFQAGLCWGLQTRFTDAECSQTDAGESGRADRGAVEGYGEVPGSLRNTNGKTTSHVCAPEEPRKRPGAGWGPGAVLSCHSCCSISGPHCAVDRKLVRREEYARHDDVPPAASVHRGDWTVCPGWPARLLQKRTAVQMLSHGGGGLEVCEINHSMK